jgi:hypothetical protein
MIRAPHSALRPFLEDKAWAEFEQTGRIQWASDLAEIPQKFGVTMPSLPTRLWRTRSSAPRWSAR